MAGQGHLPRNDDTVRSFTLCWGHMQLLPPEVASARVSWGDDEVRPDVEGVDDSGVHSSSELDPESQELCIELDPMEPVSLMQEAASEANPDPGDSATNPEKEQRGPSPANKRLHQMWRKKTRNELLENFF